MPDNACLRDDEIDAKGKIIFFVSASKLKKELQEKFPCTSGINLQKVYPATIKVEIATAGPIVKIAESVYSLTVDGKVIENNSQVQLPVIYLPAGVNIENRQIIDENSLFAVKIASLLARTDFRVAAIRVLGQEIVAYDAKQVTAHFSSQKDVSEQVDSLQQTVAAARIDGDKITRIDLRFDKPVITFK